MNNVLFSVLLVFVGLIIGIIAMFIINSYKKKHAVSSADKIIDKAQKEASETKKKAIEEAKEEINKLKVETDKEIKEKKEEIKETEKRLLTREENIDRRDQNLQNRENLLDEKEKALLDKQNDIQELEANVEEIRDQQLKLLEEISGYSKEKARELVMKNVEDSMEIEIANYIKDKENEAKEIVDKKSKSMLVESMNKS